MNVHFSHEDGVLNEIAIMALILPEESYAFRCFARQVLTSTRHYAGAPLGETDAAGYCE
jgi:hypothetical protein